MSSKAECTTRNLVLSSLCGAARGIVVHSLIHPLEVIKIRQQCSPVRATNLQIAMTILQQEGAGAFYKGLAPQLVKTSIKQMWCWPIIIGMPSILQKRKIAPLEQQVFTGLSIATIDAAISTPLEKAKIQAAATGINNFSIKNIYKDGWQGFRTYWSKRSVNWVTMLTMQQHLREQASSSEQPLSLPQLIKISAQVSLAVSIVSNPFDIADTLKQAHNLPASHLYSREGMVKLCRGWHMYALSLLIQNIATVILIEKLNKQSML